MDLGLQGKVALVAGASKGLGRAVALGLAREGVRVAILSRDPARIEAAAQEIRDATGAQVQPIVADLTRAVDIQRAVDETITQFGALHILVTNAGGPPPGTFLSVTEEQWQAAINLTLLSVVRLSRAAIPLMQKEKWGRIVHICSSSVKQSAENLMLSGSLRAAVVGLAKTQARELAPDGILVNSVLSGWMTTDRVGQLLRDRAERNHTKVNAEQSAAVKNIPVGRMGKPEELANVIAFLASERASFVTGVAMLVDGGETQTTF